MKNFIETFHFLLVYNRYRQDDSDFKVSVTTLKQAILNARNCGIEKEITGSLPLTKVMERIIKRSDFQRRVLGYKKIEPRHLYLSMLVDNGCKECYFNWMKKRGIRLNLLQRFTLNMLFIPVFKKFI